MLGEISDMRRHLIGAARRARQNSYSPYSGFRVGAALLAESGKIYTGCNMENSAFSPTICAERAAFAKAVSVGEKAFTMIAIVGSRGVGDIEEECPPCGVCRQVMSEYCGSDFRIILADGPKWRGKCGGYKEYRLCELLPLAFNIC